LIKQKLNTKSSTEAELVGATNFLPNMIWVWMILEGQGYDISENYFAQDNQSTMRLEKNGRTSCGQKSRHIDIRFFFMKDRITTEKISLVYCPTEQMIANFFTKPLQGALFKCFKHIIMGWEHIFLDTILATQAKEHVGKGENARKHQSFSESDKLLVTAGNHSGMSSQGMPCSARKADGIKCISKLNGAGDVAKIVHKYEVPHWMVKWRT